ncbi:MAG: hypothetical protein HS115_12485 [Spirochaetales bacterium]|nr:hypothetical protein [Spirochaetales bacterium]
MKLEQESVRKALFEAKKAQARQLVARGYSLESTAHILALQVERIKSWFAEGTEAHQGSQVRYGRNLTENR